MKPVRLLLFVVGALVVLALIAAAVASNGPFQTWCARRALVAQPGLTGTLGSLSAGLGRIEAGQLQLESRGAVLTLPSLAADLPVLSALLSRKVQIRRLRASGWTLDLTRARFPAGAAAPGAQVSAAVAAPLLQGAIARLQLPVDVAIDDVELSGEIIFPVRPRQPASRMQVTLRGGGLAAGRSAHFTLDLAGTAEEGGALTLQGDIVAAMDTPRTFARIEVTADAAASGPRFPQGVKLKAQAVAARSAGGESYRLVLSGEGKALADVRADLVAAGANISGRWKLDLRASDVAPFALGRVLPEFSAEGEGSFETDASFGEVHAAGRLKASADRLAVIWPKLAAVGAVTLSADFDLLQHAGSVRVERFNATVVGAKPVLSVHALQSFEFNLRTGALSVADPAQDLLWLSLQGVPLAWARPFLGDELAVTGDDARGEFAASAHAGGLTLRSKAPLTVGRLTATPLLKDADLAANLSADYTPQGWQVNVGDFVARSGGATLLNMDFKAGRLAGMNQPLKAAGHWNVNLPATLAQSAASASVRLTGGTAAGEFTASFDSTTRQFLAKFALSTLVSAAQGALPEVSGEVRADVGHDGKIAFSAPLLFERAGRKSDLLFAGTLARAAGVITLDARLSSERLVLEDLQLLTVPLAPPPAVANAATGAPAGPDVAPFWRGVSGRIDVALKKIVYPAPFQISDATGVIQVDESALRLEKVHAAFDADSELKLGAIVTFAPKSPEPYALTADLALLNFDTAPAFRALAPTKPPTIEGRINLTSRIFSHGQSLADLAARARGELELTSKGGLFRALSADISDKVQKTQSTVAVIGGILGAVTRKQEFENLNNRAQILTDIAKALSEIPFDQLSVTAARDASLNFLLKDFTLISPEVRLRGSGQITHQAGVPLLAQPLNLNLNLAARGRLGDLMKRAGLLENKQDNLGYTAFVTPLKIGGTLDKTDTSELSRALLNSALEKSGLLNTLLGK
jgi:hypothetical protein